MTDTVRVRQFQRMVELDRAFIGLFLRQAAVQYRGFGYLFINRNRRVESRRRALRQVGDVAAAQVPLPAESACGVTITIFFNKKNKDKSNGI